MKYQNCVERAQPGTAPGDIAAGTALRRSDANINPSTGLATDYLNHFNEAIMLLDMISSCPDCRDDFLAWRPMSYREHFAASRFAGRDLAIAAYEGADPAVRDRLDHLADIMSAMLEATRSALRTEIAPAAAATLAKRTAARVRPLVARAGAVINGETDSGRAPPQAVIDALMKR